MQAIEFAGAVATPHGRSVRLSVARIGWDWAGTWQGTLLMGAIGAVLGGYLGVLCVAYAWGFGRKVVFDGTLSTRRRIATAFLAAGSAAVLYDTLLTGFRLLVNI